MTVVEVRCPRCGQQSSFTREKLPTWFPFCSERCKLVDLGDWAAERYRIPSKDRPEDQDDATTDHQPKKDL